MREGPPLKGSRAIHTVEKRKNTHCFMRQEFFAESEICQDNVALRVQQDVLELDVAIDDAQLVRKKEIKRMENFQ